MPQEPPEQPDLEPQEGTGATFNSVPGDAGVVFQARDVQGGVNIGAQPNHDIEVVLQPEDHEVVLNVGGSPKTVPVTVRSQLSDPQTVTLYVTGAPTGRWTVEPCEVTVRRDHPAPATLRLPCNETDPQAGPKYLQVVAKTPKRKEQWPSRPPILVKVPARPHLDSMVIPDVLVGRICTVKVKLRNEGNTHLEGRLQRMALSSDDVSYLSPDSVVVEEDSIQSFHLDPGKSTERQVTVTMPLPSMVARRWRLPLTVELDGTDYQPPNPELTITQPGWPEKLWIWGGVKRGPYRRGSLTACAAAVFSAGTFLGLNIAPSPPAANTAAIAEPSRVVTTTPSLPPLFAPVQYVTMNCVAGKSVVYLASLTSKEADAYAAYLVQREYNRMRSLDTPARHIYDIHVTERRALCEFVRQQLDKKPEMAPFSVFLWIGPVPTNEASSVCTDLDLGQSFDCSTAPMS